MFALAQTRSGDSHVPATTSGRKYVPSQLRGGPCLEGRNRLTTFFRYIVAIPWLIVASIYGFVAEIAAVIAWFAIVFTGKYPEGLYNFNAGYLRMASRVNGFDYLLTDEWPPFDGERRAGYPIRVGVAPPLDEIRPPEDAVPPHRRDPRLPARARPGDHPGRLHADRLVRDPVHRQAAGGLFNPMRSRPPI